MKRSLKAPDSFVKKFSCGATRELHSATFAHKHKRARVEATNGVRPAPASCRSPDEIGENPHVPIKTYSIWLPLLAASISACGQILLKHAMTQVGPLNFSPGILLRAMRQPFLPVALVIYALALLLWLEVLSKTPLSVAYPVLAVTYVMVPLISQFVFHERLDTSQYVGMFLILAGVALIGR